MYFQLYSLMTNVHPMTCYYTLNQGNLLAISSLFHPPDVDSGTHICRYFQPCAEWIPKIVSHYCQEAKNLAGSACGRQWESHLNFPYISVWLIPPYSNQSGPLVYSRSFISLRQNQLRQIVQYL